MHQMFHPDVMDARRESHDLLVGAYMREAYEAAAASMRKPEPIPLPFPERTKADFTPEHGRMGRCVCCAEKKFIPAMQHVCGGCFNELEEERV